MNIRVVKREGAGMGRQIGAYVAAVAAALVVGAVLLAIQVWSLLPFISGC